MKWSEEGGPSVWIPFNFCLNLIFLISVGRDSGDLDTGVFLIAELWGFFVKYSLAKLEINGFVRLTVFVWRFL